MPRLLVPAWARVWVQSSALTLARTIDPLASATSLVCWSELLTAHLTVLKSVRSMVPRTVHSKAPVWVQSSALTLVRTIDPEASATLLVC